jgi:CheY-like chemotaxis protein
MWPITANVFGNRSDRREKKGMQKLLVVSADSEERQRLAGLLQGHERKVLEAVSGADGLDAAREVHPDAIVLDLPLADMAGLDLCSQLHADGHTGDIPLLVILEHGDMASIEAAFEAGAKNVLSRPFTITEFEQKVRGLSSTGRELSTDLEPPPVLRNAYDRVQEKGRTLGDVAEIFGGVIAKERHLYAEAPQGPEWKRLLVESDIEPHLTSFGGMYVRYKPRQLVRVPPPELAGAVKVVVRRSAPPLTAAVDRDRYLPGETVYGIVPAGGLLCEYVSALLNSRLMDFFIRRIRPLRQQKGYAPMLRTIDLEDMPIILPDRSQQEAIAALVRAIEDLGHAGRYSPAEKQKYLAGIDRGIFEICGFGKNEVKRLSDLSF